MSEAAQRAENKPQSVTFGRERLSPGAYALDLSVVSDIPVKDSGEPSAFGDLYGKLGDSKIEQMPGFSRGDKYVTDKGDVELDCEWPRAGADARLLASAISRRDSLPAELWRASLSERFSPWSSWRFYFLQDVSILAMDRLG